VWNTKTRSDAKFTKREGAKTRRNPPLLRAPQSSHSAILALRGLRASRSSCFATFVRFVISCSKRFVLRVPNTSRSNHSTTKDHHMARIIKLKCETCGNPWEEDLDQPHPPVALYKGVYRGAGPRTHRETYLFRCPHDGTEVVVDVDIEE
jgi:hypothetical protein